MSSDAEFLDVDGVATSKVVVTMPADVLKLAEEQVKLVAPSHERVGDPLGKARLATLVPDAIALCGTANIVGWHRSVPRPLPHCFSAITV